MPGCDLAALDGCGDAEACAGDLGKSSDQVWEVADRTGAVIAATAIVGCLTWNGAAAWLRDADVYAALLVPLLSGGMLALASWQAGRMMIARTRAA